MVVEMECNKILLCMDTKGGKKEIKSASKDFKLLRFAQGSAQLIN